jgi:3-hydroxyisobutyrate dehydrogenase-like beta-hydroxyacid dehydrogenase
VLWSQNTGALGRRRRPMRSVRFSRFRVVARIAVLHPGEMGAAIGAALVRGGHDVGWLSAGRSAYTSDRAASAGLRELEDVSGCEVVLSVCPPSAALDTARSVTGFAGHYVDANAISPVSAAEVCEVVSSWGAKYVDAGIIGAPPSETSTVRLYLSGEGADAIADLFDDTAVHAEVLGTGGAFAASAIKMSYASWSKISQALVLAADGAAAALGVGDALHEEWAASQPSALKLLDSALASAHAKGWRWEGEMHEIARTFTANGQPGEFGTAAAAIFRRFRRQS